MSFTKSICAWICEMWSRLPLSHDISPWPCCRNKKVGGIYRERVFSILNTWWYQSSWLVLDVGLWSTFITHGCDWSKCPGTGSAFSTAGITIFCSLHVREMIERDNNATSKAKQGWQKASRLVSISRLARDKQASPSRPSLLTSKGWF